ncbi:MAG: hypothetical protein H7832_01020 [Magnetococcus sp. DMHC-6]
MDTTQTEMIKQFLLLFEKEEIKISSNYWHSSGLYFNDICFVVCLELKNPNKDKPFDQVLKSAKNDLYELLKRMDYLVSDVGLMRPIACILKKESLGERFKEVVLWGADQEWHRGAFTVYVEPDEIQSENEHIIAGMSWRIFDLLVGNVLEINPNEYQPATNWDYLQKIDHLVKQNEKDDATKYAQDILTEIQGTMDLEEQQMTIDAVLEAWRNKKLQMIDDRIRGN